MTRVGSFRKYAAFQRRPASSIVGLPATSQPQVTVASPQVTPGSVGTTQLANGAVTGAKLGLETFVKGLDADEAMNNSTLTDVTGLTATVANGGTYLVAVMAHLNTNAAPVVQLSLIVNGSADAKSVFGQQAASTNGSISGTWIVTASASQVIKVQAKDTSVNGAGNILANGTQMVISQVA